eukprot:GEMP01012931.1.p1 GENE.GEMP01012931.1~~GEMP01012931.1.p1  ORF type:complete len:962 (+),score=219.09 GEMP01012931.1:137-3022(+)
MERVTRVTSQVTSAQHAEAEPIRGVDVLVIGGGAAGIGCVKELLAIIDEMLEGPAQFSSIVLVDSGERLGGSLWSHSHNIVGVSEYFPYAGLPSDEAAKLLVDGLAKHRALDVCLEATAIAAFSDGNVGVHFDDRYVLFRPQNLVVAAGSREEFVIFNGNVLPGVIFLKRFLRLKKLDGKKIVFAGGSNAGATAALDAVKRGADVVAIVSNKFEIYQVHLDALERCGVKLIHGTIASAEGHHKVHACVARTKTGPVAMDADMIVMAADTVPQIELYEKATSWNVFPCFLCGESEGTVDLTRSYLAGRRVARQIVNHNVDDLLAKEGKLIGGLGDLFERNHVFEPGGHRVFPVIHDRQEMACTVCKSACKEGLIAIDDVPRGLPHFVTHKGQCSGCGDCLVTCPGTAITLVDTRWSRTTPNVTFVVDVPVPDDLLGKVIEVFGREGNVLGSFPVAHTRQHRNKTLVTVKIPQLLAMDANGIARRGKTEIKKTTCAVDIEDLGIVCRCESVNKEQIKSAGKRANNDMNQVKALTRQGMGQCGGFQCTHATAKLLGSQVTKSRNVRALNLEISLGQLTSSVVPDQPRTRVPLLPFEIAQQENYFDVIILGAGSIGVPTSMVLAEHYKRVLVLDSSISMGQGDNKRAIGGVRATFGNPGKILVALESIDMIRTWKAIHGDDVEWKDGGYLFVVYTEVVELVPNISQEGLRGGIYSPKDGMATPYLAANAFFKRAITMGAQFKFQEHVVCFLKNSLGEVNGCQTVDSKGRAQKWYAPVIINALGAKCNEVLSCEGISLPITIDSHEGGVTRPASAINLRPLVIDIRAAPGSQSFYFYQNIRGQIVFCITPDPPIIGYDRHETSEFLPQISRRLIDLIPSLKNVQVRRVWRGLYANTADGNPLVGWDKTHKGLFHACGMGGQGFMLGCGVARLISRMLRNDLRPNDEYVLREFNPARKIFGSEEKLR